MIIGTVRGDLISIFKSGTGHLIHGCNCFHTMGAGIARQIAREFPQALETNKMTAYGDPDKLGTLSCWEHVENIINLATPDIRVIVVEYYKKG